MTFGFYIVLACELFWALSVLADECELLNDPPPCKEEERWPT